MKERNIAFGSILGIMATVGGMAIASNYSNRNSYENGRRAGYEEGRKVGLGEGSRETRQRIASDLAELGVQNPVRMISDHPSIPPTPVPYFLENEFKQRGEKK